MRDCNGDGDIDGRDYYDDVSGAWYSAPPDIKSNKQAPAAGSGLSLLFFVLLSILVIWLIVSL